MNDWLLRVSVQFNQHRELFTDELESNKRLVWMTWGIFYLLLMYLIVGTHDYNEILESRVDRLERESARMTDASQISAWETRLEREEELRGALSSSCWNSRNETLASADVQTSLQNITSEHGLDNSRLNVARPEPYLLDAGDFWLIRVNVNGRIKSGQLPPLVHALETAEKSFLVDQLRFVDARAGGSVDMTVLVCAKRDLT